MIILNSTSPELVIPEADPVSMYIIVNADLQLSPAKLAVQVGHGVELYYQSLVILSDVDLALDPVWRLWIGSGSRKIVLKANPTQWNKIKECDEISGYLVKDAGLTECEPNAETCIVLPPRRKSTIHKLIKRLQLL